MQGAGAKPMRVLLRVGVGWQMTKTAPEKDPGVISHQEKKDERNATVRQKNKGEDQRWDTCVEKGECPATISKETQSQLAICAVESKIAESQAPSEEESTVVFTSTTPTTSTIYILELTSNISPRRV